MDPIIITIVVVFFGTIIIGELLKTFAGIFRVLITCAALYVIYMLASELLHG